MTIGITGACGQLGRLVSACLIAAGDAPPLVLLSRTPDALAPVPGVTTRHGDFADAAGLDAAFAGVRTLLLISTDSVGVRLDQHRTAIAAAVRAGVERIVYTSVPEPVPDNPAFVVPDHAGTEAALRDSGVAWVALRNNLYSHMQVPSIRQAAASGQLVTNSGDGRAAYVTREDCAAVAAAALVRDDLVGAFDVTGPQALTAADLARLAGELSGTEVAVVQVDDDERIAGLRAAGLPEPLARGLASFGAAIRGGYLATASTTVADLTGRPATPLSDLLAG
jgi:NAD(P)H dehydrogenase (quinone)